MSALRELKSVDDCQLQVERAFKESPEEFESTAQRVELFLQSISLEERSANEHQIKSLKEKITNYSFQTTIQKLKRDHSQGKDIVGDFIETLNHTQRYILYNNFSLSESMAKQLLKLGENTGVFESRDPFPGNLRFSRDSFIELVRLHGVELEKPNIIWQTIQGIASTLFSPSLNHRNRSTHTYSATPSQHYQPPQYYETLPYLNRNNWSMHNGYNTQVKFT